jgi:hypothetical protein
MISGCQPRDDGQPPLPLGEGWGEGLKCLTENAKPLTRRFASTSPTGEVKRAQSERRDKSQLLRGATR